MERHNCPNCGAPIESTQCPYCGTVLYDFTEISNERPTYIMMNWNGTQVAFRALLEAAEINMETMNPVIYADNQEYVVDTCSAAEASFEFRILADDNGVLLKRKDMRRVTDT